MGGAPIALGLSFGIFLKENTFFRKKAAAALRFFFRLVTSAFYY